MSKIGKKKIAGKKNKWKKKQNRLRPTSDTVFFRKLMAGTVLELVLRLVLT